MRILWTPEAEQDRVDIWDYIASENPKAAAKMDALFGEATARLNAYPLIGRTGIIPGTREIIPHKNYRLVYEIKEEIVWILALVHAARRWPPVQ